MGTSNAEEIMEWGRRLEESWTLVGEFMYNFAMVESALDDLIGAMMGLEILSAAILTSNIIISKKIDIAICGVQLQHIDRDAAIKDIRKIREINNYRNIAAHCVFIPASSGDGVEFHRTSAKERLDLDTVVWRKADFRVRVKMMEKLHKRLRALIEAVSPVQEGLLAMLERDFAYDTSRPDEDV